MIDPVRVIVDSEGYGVPPSRAEQQYSITSDIVFKRRGDGWTLGAPKQYESIAFRMWADEWESFSYDGESWSPISEYRGL